MKIVALAFIAALLAACSPGSGDAKSPSATLSSQPPSQPLTLACAQFGSAPVTDLARLVALEDPAERDRGLADISNTVIAIASDVEQAAASAPGTQAGALTTLDSALTDYSTALTAYREAVGDPYGPALGPVIEAMRSVQAACAAGSATAGGGESGESAPA
jgi:hypothetical protein